MLEERSAEQTRKAPWRNRWVLIALAVVVFAAVVVVGQLSLGSAEESAAVAPERIEDLANAAPNDSPAVRRDPADPMAIGDVDAPVVLSEWTDLRCPFCAAFSRDTLPELIDEYVDSGALRIEITDVAYFGPESEDAAVAARAAANQDHYFEFLDAVYAAAPERGHADLPRERLIEFAEISGVPDLDRFTADLDDPLLRESVQTATMTAQSLGVRAVPFFVAGSSALSGAQPTEIFHRYLGDAFDEVS